MENKSFQEGFKKIINIEAQPLIASSLFKYVKDSKEEQPNSVKELLTKIEEGSIENDIFSEAYEIKGHKFLFAKMSPLGSYVFCLVQDKNNSKKWKSRGFHFSNSDHQFKLTAGERKSGSVMKGDESNPLHHYVQSGKISKEIYKVFNNISRANDNEHTTGLDNNLPGYLGKFQDEFELKEDFLDLKNPEWSQFQKECQKFYYGDYRNLVQIPFHQPKDNTLEKSDGSYLRFDEYLHNNPPRDIRIKALLRAKDAIIGKANMPGADTKEISQAWIKWQRDYPELVGEYIREQFQKPMPQSMIPNFSRANIIDAYKKWDANSQNKKDHIYIEEYEVKSPEGDNLIFAMAYNELGQVYIDNIYDPRVGINDYGIQSKIVNMGHLVYKPEDYSDQTIGISKSDKKTVDRDYEDITSLWENIAVIKNYKQELIKRSVLK